MKKRIETEDVVRSLHPRGRRTSRPCYKKGKLDDAFVERAVEDGARRSVVASLALLAGISAETTGRILDSGLGKADRLSRLAGGPQRARGLQNPDVLLRLPAGELLPARDGVRFPLTEDQMRWHLNYFGVDRLNEPIVADMGDKSACTLDVGRFKPLAHIAMGFATVAAVDVEEHV